MDVWVEEEYIDTGNGVKVAKRYIEYQQQPCEDLQELSNWLGRETKGWKYRFNWFAKRLKQLKTKGGYYVK